MSMLALGTPPRVRRRQYLDSLLPGRARNTSARAEKTRGMSALNGVPPEHLRACGEDTS